MSDVWRKVFDSLGSFEMEFHVVLLCFGVDKFVSMRAVSENILCQPMQMIFQSNLPIHVAIAIRDATVAEMEQRLMRCLGPERNHVPEH